MSDNHKKNNIEMCEFYPNPDEKTCVCGAGSDISGAMQVGVCAIDYSKECQWANELRLRNSKITS